MRLYYARYSRWGIRSQWGNSGKWTGDYYAFKSKKERDEWVENHEWDYYPNCSACEVTRAEVVSQLGKKFVVVDYSPDNFDSGFLCHAWKKGSPVWFDNYDIYSPD